MDDIKNLLDSIISDGNNKHIQNSNERAAFDKNEFKERMSFGILKDMTHAMMHDEPPEDESMVDDAIMRHIKDDYKGTCFGYLCDARDRLKSPLLNDVIQEIEEAANDVEDIENDPDISDEDKDNAHNINVEELTKNVPLYSDFRDRLKEETSNMVVKDVAYTILNSQGAPVYDKIDEKIRPVDNAEDAQSSEDTGLNSEPDLGEVPELNESSIENPSMDNTNNNVPTGSNNDIDTLEPAPETESAILRMTDTIVTEYACKGIRISTEEGMERAICEYCVQQMCFLFKDMTRSPYDRLLK